MKSGRVARVVETEIMLAVVIAASRENCPSIEVQSRIEIELRLVILEARDKTLCG